MRHAAARRSHCSSVHKLKLCERAHRWPLRVVLREVSCCRCFDGFGGKKKVQGGDGEDFEVDLGVNEVIWNLGDVGRWIF